MTNTQFHKRDRKTDNEGEKKRIWEKKFIRRQRYILFFKDDDLKKNHGKRKEYLLTEKTRIAYRNTKEKGSGTTLRLLM